MTLFDSGELDYFKTISNAILIAWVRSEVQLTIEKLDVIMEKTDSFANAVTEDFFTAFQSDRKWLNKWQKQGKIERLELFVSKLDDHDIKIVSCFDSNYPRSLLDLHRPPVALYYQGDIGIINEKSNQFITVVGSRNFTKYAELCINKILKPVCRLGVGVVSGLAYGIDGVSHQIAVDAEALTVGVIGSGLDRSSFYPMANWSLRTNIIRQGGVVISEYAPGVAPNRYTFPERNRILSALTNVTWVVQAAAKSGTLITADMTRDLGRIVATTPGSILEPTMAGNINLIKDGANIITEPDDIIQLLGLSGHVDTNLYKAKDYNFSNETEKQIYTVLSLEPMLVEDISDKCNLDTTEVSATLTMLELAGIVASVGQNRWVRGN